MSGFLDKILENLGLKKDKDDKTAAGGQAGGNVKTAPQAGVRTAPGHDPQRKVVSEVDVVKKLEGLSGGNDNWKVSIVELLTLLKIDSSREARIELAKELGATPDIMEDSARMNIWLHKEVLRKIAANGGNVPRELLD